MVSSSRHNNETHKNSIQYNKPKFPDYLQPQYTDILDSKSIQLLLFLSLAFESFFFFLRCYTSIIFPLCIVVLLLRGYGNGYWFAVGVLKQVRRYF